MIRQVAGTTNFRDRTRDQSFTYDQLNRLTPAQNSGTNCAASTVNGKTEYWGNSYGYDAWGNLTDKTVTKCGAENFHPGAASVNNQLPGYGYDAAGNMTSDPTDGVSSTYDAENRIASEYAAGGFHVHVRCRRESRGKIRQRHGHALLVYDAGHHGRI